MTDTQELIRNFFVDDYGNPLEATDGQDQIFRAVAKKENSRVHIMCHTRYGKSLFVGLAVLLRAASFPEKWAIIAGTKEKAKIIMSYVNAHIFDNDYIKSRFLPEKGESIEDIRRHRNKNHVTFYIGKNKEGKKLYGEIFVGSAKDALGFGAPNVVEDESALISNDDHSLVMRMLGDDPSKNFLVKIGNPFNRNHFLDSYHDPAYKKIVWDCYKSLREGRRMTQALIEENRPYSFFNVLYECKFPRAAEVDESGWMYLLTDDDVKKATERQVEPYGDRKLGVDVARGGRNFNVWVMRGANYAEVLKKTNDNDLITVADETVNLMRENGISQGDVFIDDTGVGGGVTDYLRSKGIEVTAVKFGEKAEDENYANLKAELFAGKEGLSSWLKQSGTLKPHKDWIELTKVRYRKDDRSKTKIEPKEDMRKRGVESPDVADALALTFAKRKGTCYHSVDPALILAGGVKPFYEGMPG